MKVRRMKHGAMLRQLEGLHLVLGPALNSIDLVLLSEGLRRRLLLAHHQVTRSHRRRDARGLIPTSLLLTQLDLISWCLLIGTVKNSPLYVDINLERLVVTFSLWILFLSSARSHEWVHLIIKSPPETKLMMQVQLFLLNSFSIH